ncbi:hypothetical protein B0H15DRAFT_168278 [Mycena belliarum]|uniref:Uncharacterized protein n=1 Tax=Mycena belliarum TaxID=1033014 RepID=A0AAD6XKI3_9AGAR|nr:hypothetical protein B0H15DRAFT_168278 [Mycena belliae]
MPASDSSSPPVASRRVNGDHKNRYNHLNFCRAPVAQCSSASCSRRLPSRALHQRGSCFPWTIRPRDIAPARRPRFCVRTLATPIAASLAPYPALRPPSMRPLWFRPGPRISLSAPTPPPALPAHPLALRTAHSTDAATSHSQPQPPSPASLPDAALAWAQRAPPKSPTCRRRRDAGELGSRLSFKRLAQTPLEIPAISRNPPSPCCARAVPNQWFNLSPRSPCIGSPHIPTLFASQSAARSFHSTPLRPTNMRRRREGLALAPAGSTCQTSATVRARHRLTPCPTKFPLPSVPDKQLSRWRALPSFFALASTLPPPILGQNVCAERSHARTYKRWEARVAVRDLAARARYARTAPNEVRVTRLPCVRDHRRSLFHTPPLWRSSAWTTSSRSPTFASVSSVWTSNLMHILYRLVSSKLELRISPRLDHPFQASTATISIRRPKSTRGPPSHRVCSLHAPIVRTRSSPGVAFRAILFDIRIVHFSPR